MAYVESTIVNEFNYNYECIICWNIINTSFTFCTKYSIIMHNSGE